MAFQTIGDINLAIADREAGAIERESEGFKTLGENVRGSVNNALESASMLQKQAIDEQMQKEADALLKSGAQGVEQYVAELNAQGANLDPRMYTNWAKTIKKPEEYKAVYIAANKQAEKNAITNSVNEAMMSIEADLQDAISTSDPDKIAKTRNKVGLAMANAKTDEARKQLSVISKTLDDAATRVGKQSNAKPGEVTKGIRTLRKDFNSEPAVKKASTILDQANILERAAENGEFVKPDGSKTRLAQDQALVMTFNKILDPDSVVRESEYGRSGASAGALEALKGWFKGLTEGGANLTNAGRAAILKVGRIIAETARVDMFQQMSDYERFGKLEGVSDENLDLINQAFSKFGNDYIEYKKDPEGYKERYFAETNKMLNNVMNETGGVVKNKNTSGQQAGTPPKEAASSSGSSNAQKSVKLSNGKTVNIGSTFKTKDGRMFRVLGKGQYEEIK